MWRRDYLGNGSPKDTSANDCNVFVWHIYECGGVDELAVGGAVEFVQLTVSCFMVAGMDRSRLLPLIYNPNRHVDYQCFGLND